MKRQTLWTAVLAAGIGMLVVGAEFTVCPMAGVFGIPCPSCGLTRATLALLSGNVARAWFIHPGVFLVLALFLLLAARRLVWRGEPFDRWLTVLGVVVVALLTLLWGARFLGRFGGPVPVQPWHSEVGCVGLVSDAFRDCARRHTRGPQLRAARGDCAVAP